MKNLDNYLKEEEIEIVPNDKSKLYKIKEDINEVYLTLSLECKQNNIDCVMKAKIFKDSDNTISTFSRSLYFGSIYDQDDEYNSADIKATDNILFGKKYKFIEIEFHNKSRFPIKFSVSFNDNHNRIDNQAKFISL